MLSIILGLLVPVIPVILALVLLYFSVAIAKGDEILVLERKWFGKQMADGRTVALKGEVGVQARTLGPGFHLLMPFIYKVKKYKYLVIGPAEVGMVTSITGRPIPSGKFFANPVQCDLFQDGESFLINGGEKGTQIHILPPGEYRINPHLFTVEKVACINIEDGQVGLVEAVDGMPCPVGRVFAKTVLCDNFQDGEAFLKNGGEKGPQVPIIPPGKYRINTKLFRVRIESIVVIHEDEVGLVEAVDGMPCPVGNVFAKSVVSNHFQDGDMFFKNGGEKGPQVPIIPPGKFRINTALFKVTIQKIVSIADDEVGIVNATAGKPIKVGRIFAEPVECNLFQNGEDFLNNDGQKGPQIEILAPGKYRINTNLFKVQKSKVTVIPGGHIGLVTAMDGAQIPEGRLLAKKIDGHSNFEKGLVFIVNGGEKGRQLDHLMPGTYRINTALFQVSEPIPWTTIAAEEVGIVTVLEGKPIMDASKIAAEIIPLETHNNYQDASAFIQAGGQKGLQIPVLRSGNYAINSFFALIEKRPMTEVKIGECGVVTNFVGEEGEDLTSSDVNAKIVANGRKGIWKDPLQPGRHALNTKVCKVDIVPTTQILLNWADNQSSAHKFDANLKTITLRTADAFNVNMDVSVIIHIAMEDAPKVVANLGSVTNMISQVLEPAISSHFRNAAQKVKALDLYTERAEIQEAAKGHIQEVLKVHHIESKDTMIADVVLPLELTKTVTDRQIAEQEKKTYVIQGEAQEERRKLENSKAQADMQTKVVESERNVEIAENQAKSAIKVAEGTAKAIELNADGQAKATKLKADADAEYTQKTGEAQAKVILAQGESTATAYELQVKAMGQGNFGAMKVVELVANSGLELMPKNLIISGGEKGGNDVFSNLIGVNLLNWMKTQPVDVKEDDVKEDNDKKEKTEAA